MSSVPTNYQHTQRAPLCLLLYGLSVMFLVLAWMERNELPIRYVFPFIGVLVFFLQRPSIT